MGKNKWDYPHRTTAAMTQYKSFGDWLKSSAAFGLGKFGLVLSGLTLSYFGFMEMTKEAEGETFNNNDVDMVLIRQKGREQFGFGVAIASMGLILGSKPPSQNQD